MSVNPADFAASVQGLIALLGTALSNPADAVRTLAQLASFKTDTPASGDAIGIAMAGISDASDDLFQRSAASALAIAASQYQPSSASDAFTVMTTVSSLLDQLGVEAADKGDDASFLALKQLRNAVIQDLTVRGAQLAPIVTFRTSLSLPAGAAAVRFYRDPSRADELVAQANPIHPLFLPVSFQALAT